MALPVSRALQMPGNEGKARRLRPQHPALHEPGRRPRTQGRLPDDHRHAAARPDVDRALRQGMLALADRTGRMGPVARHVGHHQVRYLPALTLSGRKWPRPSLRDARYRRFSAHEDPPAVTYWADTDHPIRRVLATGSRWDDCSSRGGRERSVEPSAVSTRASGKPDVIHCRIRLYMKQDGATRHRPALPAPGSALEGRPARPRRPSPTVPNDPRRCPMI
jgi:hypothetical protein